jgi:hypothetical protein
MLPNKEGKVHECPDYHCSITIKDNKIIEYILFLYSDDSGSVRYRVNAQGKHTDFYSRPADRKWYKSDFTLDFFIPLRIDQEGVLRGDNLFDADKIKKYILFS